MNIDYKRKLGASQALVPVAKKLKTDLVAYDLEGGQIIEAVSLNSNIIHSIIA